MSVIILTWKLEKSDEWWPDRQVDTASVRNGNPPPIEWRCRAKTSPGQICLVFKQGRAPNGLCGMGRVAEKPSPSNGSIYVNFVTLLDPSAERILERSGIADIRVKQSVWNTRASGVRVEDPQASELIKRWTKFIGRGVTPYSEEEEYATEGAPYYALRKHRAREQWKRKEKIDAVLRKKCKLECEVPGCGFNFEATYGKIGRSYAHVHHLKQLSDSENVVETRLKDLAIVCANCHAMIHKGGKNRSLTRMARP